MHRLAPVVIPSSIQRVRHFMNTEGRFKVKPWADVDETLDAFYALLANRSENDAFWTKLRGLMEDLASDLKKRSRFAGRALHNEVLDSTRYDDLLEEIRVAAAAFPDAKGSFVKSLASLSAPAMSLLLLLGGVMTAGCYQNTGVDEDGVGADAGTSGDADVDGDSDADTDGDTDTNGDGDTDTKGDLDSDLDSDPDTAEATDTLDSDSGDGTDGKTLESIIEQVVADPDEQADILACIDSLHESWYSGLEELFRGESESQILDDLRCLMDNRFSSSLCSDPEAAPEYSYDALLNNCIVVVYLGVKFE